MGAKIEEGGEESGEPVEDSLDWTVEIWDGYIQSGDGEGGKSLVQPTDHNACSILPCLAAAVMAESVAEVPGQEG